ncbi:MAG: septal ring lytic transglycosylase RlpA family protein [Candidatus Ryanbacteria bacterium]|nr:septal ring lytic transglycosylase RlpA family protein [Candidatus Ryanbacteria bacterium]
MRKLGKSKRLILRASWYGPRFHGRTRADNRVFNMHEPIVAHKFWPLGTLICVTNKANGKYGCFRVRDRGPYVEGRDLDFSLAAARQLGFEHTGLADVIVTGLSFPRKSRTSS